MLWVAWEPSEKGGINQSATNLGVGEELFRGFGMDSRGFGTEWTQQDASEMELGCLGEEKFGGGFSHGMGVSQS